VYLLASQDLGKKLEVGKAPFYRQEWKRFSNCTYARPCEDEGWTITLPFTEKPQPTEYLFIAFVHPYTLGDYWTAIEELKLSYPKKNGRATLEVADLCKSPEGRKIHILTLTSSKPAVKNRPVIFLTGRVHASETPGSYTL